MENIRLFVRALQDDACALWEEGDFRGLVFLAGVALVVVGVTA